MGAVMAVKAKVTIHLGWTEPERMRAAVEREKPALAEWRQERAEQRLRGRRMTSQEWLEWREETAQLLAAEQAAGRLLATQTAAVEWGARDELAERGWNHHEWPAVPNRARLSGRWPGSRDVGAPHIVVVPVDAALVEQVLAACWWTSVSAMTKLRAWRDAHPGLEFGSAMDNYEELSAQVTTTGEVWRAAVRRVIRTYTTEDNTLIQL
jgi:hypothetical protein